MPAGLPEELPPGTELGAYVIRSTIASGGGGTVFLAEDRSRKQSVAIKVLHPELARSSVGVARFLREVRVVNMIRHPAIVDIYELGALPDGRPYFVMELLEGSDLRRLITSKGRFSAEETLEIVSIVCGALEAAHKAGIVHRDLKASNINLGTKDGKRVVKLLDFGVAKLIAPDPDMPGLTQAGARLGTATAMAPEQIRCEPIDHRTDVYALGVLIFHMLTGRVPFRGATPQEIERMIIDTAAPKPSASVPVSPAVDAVVLRCMEKDRAKRYDSAMAVADALRAAIAGQAPSVAIAKPKQAVAVYVDARAKEGSDETDEELFDDLASVLDLAEQTLQKAGFTVLMQTGSALLGARVLPEDGDVARKEEDTARDNIVELSRQIARRQGAHPELLVDVRLHVDAATVKEGGPSAVIGGAIVDVSSWPTHTLVQAS
jgi:serine/threonine protein kinase